MSSSVSKELLQNKCRFIAANHEIVSETRSLQLVYLSENCRRHFHWQPHVAAPPNPSTKQVCAHCLLIMSSTAALDTETEPWWSSTVPTFMKVPRCDTLGTIESSEYSSVVQLQLGGGHVRPGQPPKRDSPLWEFADSSSFDPMCPQHGLNLGSTLANLGTWAQVGPLWRHPCF